MRASLWRSNVEILDGRKTYVGLFLLGALGLAMSFGWLDETTFGVLVSVVGTLTGVSMRHGVQKAQDAAEGF